MIVEWIHQYIPADPDVVAANQTALIESNPDLFWLFVAVAALTLLVTLAQKDYVGFWCFGVVAACMALMCAVPSAALDGLWSDVILIALGVAGVVFMADLSAKQRKLTGSGGLGCMWVFALLVAGLAAWWLLSR